MEGTVWEGVGHENYRGGSSRNAFGVDFAANGHVSFDKALFEFGTF